MLRPAACLLVCTALAACGGGDDTAEEPSPTTPATATATTTETAAGPVDELVDVGGHALHVVCQGEGVTTVVVEMGAGQRVAAWNGTQVELADAGHRACVYERAGTGDSEPGPEPRSSAAIADELDALLSAAGITEPVVLVSHSLGGLHAQAFAQRHGDRVAGLVFVDPRTAEYQLGYRDVITADELRIDTRDLEQAIASEPFGPELAVLDQSAADVAAAGELPDVPVVVLTAGVPFPGQSQGDIDFWHETHEHLAAQSSAGRAEVVDGAEHEIWRTHSSTVVDAVVEVAAAG